MPKGKKTSPKKRSTSGFEEYVYNGLRRAYLRKIARRAGIKRISKDLVFSELRQHALDFTEKLVRWGMAYAENGRRSTINALDIINGLKDMTTTRSTHFVSTRK